MSFILPAKPNNCIIDLRAYHNTDSGLDVDNFCMYNLAKIYNPDKAADNAVIENLSQAILGDGDNIPFYVRLLGDGLSKIRIPHSEKLMLSTKFSIEITCSIEEDMVEHYNSYANVWYFWIKAVFTGVGWFKNCMTGARACLRRDKIHHIVVTYDENYNLVGYSNKIQAGWEINSNKINNVNTYDFELISFENKPVKIYSYRLYDDVLTMKDICDNYEIAFKDSQITENIVTIENETIKTLPQSSFISSNWLNANNSAGTTNLMTQNNQLKTLADFTKFLGIKTLRFPSGVYVASFFWDIPYNDLIEGFNNWTFWRASYLKNISRENMWFVDDILAYCREHNLKIIMQVNNHAYFDKETKTISFTKDGTHLLTNTDYPTGNGGNVDWELVDKMAASAKELVQYIYDSGNADLIAYWEIGNEDYAIGAYSNYFLASEYAQLASVFIEKMREVDSNLKVMLTFTEGDSDYWAYYVMGHVFGEDMLASGHLDNYKNDGNIYYAPHYYYSVAYEKSLNQKASDNPTFNTFENCIDQTLNGHNIIIRDNCYRTLINGGVTNPKIIVGEFNAFNLSDRNMSSYLGALANARTILSAVNTLGFMELCHFELLDVYTTSSSKFLSDSFGVLLRTFETDKLKSFILLPTAHIIKLFNKYIYKNVLKTESNNHNVEIAATYDTGKMSVIIVNIGSDRTINLDLPSNCEFKKSIVIGEGLPLDYNVLNINDSEANPSEIRKISYNFNNLSIINNSVELKANTINILLFKRT